MKAILFTAIAVCALSLPASAQRMGSSNNNAPTIEQKIDLGQTGTLELTYTGITFGQGAWASALKDEKRRERMRTRINSTADTNPLGSFSFSKSVMIGETSVAAGDYKLAFKLNDAYEWELVLAGSDSSTSVPLTMTDNPEPSKRLVISLYAGDEDFTAGLYLAFGQKLTMLTITPGAAAGAEKQ